MKESQIANSVGVKPAVLLGIIAVWVLTLGTMACNTASPTNASGGSAASQVTPQWLKQKAQESGGDFQRLNAEDQRLLTTQYGKMAPFVLKGNTKTANDNF